MGFEDICRNIYDRIEIWFNIENDPIYSPKFKKRLRWVGYVGIPGFLSFVSIILVFYIMFRVYNKVGFEQAVLVIMILILISIRSFGKKAIV